MKVAERIAALVLGVALTASVAQAGAAFSGHVAGDWMGTLRSAGETRHIAVHIHRTPDGAYAGTMTSPELGGANIPLRPLAAGRNVLAFAADGARFRGDWDPRHERWDGTWTQSGENLPLRLTQNDDNAFKF